MSAILFNLTMQAAFIYLVIGIMEKYENWKTQRRINQMTDEEFRQNVVDEVMEKVGKWKG